MMMFARRPSASDDEKTRKNINRPKERSLVAFLGDIFLNYVCAGINKNTQTAQ